MATSRTSYLPGLLLRPLYRSDPWRTRTMITASIFAGRPLSAEPRQVTLCQAFNKAAKSTKAAKVTQAAKTVAPKSAISTKAVATHNAPPPSGNAAQKKTNAPPTQKPNAPKAVHTSAAAASAPKTTPMNAPKAAPTKAGPVAKAPATKVEGHRPLSTHPVAKGAASSKAAGPRPQSTQPVAKGAAGSNAAGPRPLSTQPAGKGAVGSKAAGPRPQSTQPVAKGPGSSKTTGPRPHSTQPVTKGAAGSKTAGPRPHPTQPVAKGATGQKAKSGGAATVQKPATTSASESTNTASKKQAKAPNLPNPPKPNPPKPNPPTSNSPKPNPPKPNILAKPTRFNPPSHGARLPKSTPKHYGGPMTTEERQAQEKKQYPGLSPPPNTWAHWFLHQKFIHMIIAVSLLASMTVYTYAARFNNTSPYASMVPPISEFPRHPLSYIRTVFEAVRLHEAHLSYLTAERYRSKMEDVAKRKEYRKAHGLPAEMGVESWFRKAKVGSQEQEVESASSAGEAAVAEAEPTRTLEAAAEDGYVNQDGSKKRFWGNW